MSNCNRRQKQHPDMMYVIVMIVMGPDLNAKIGEDNEGCEKVMGQHELGRMNEIGERLPMFNVATMTW